MLSQHTDLSVVRFSDLPDRDALSPRLRRVQLARETHYATRRGGHFIEPRTQAFSRAPTNLYVYAGSGPTDFTDPFGLQRYDLKNLLPSVCGGGGFGYGGAGGHVGPIHGELLGLVEYDSRLGGAHGGLLAAGAWHFTGGVESMRTWSDWQAHTTPIGLGGVEIPGASGAFGKQINTQSRDIGGLAQYENGNLSLGFYAGTTLGSGRAFGGGAYITLSWSGCHE